jgi:hypothetical protein
MDRRLDLASSTEKVLGTKGFFRLLNVRVMRLECWAWRLPRCYEVERHLTEM